MFFYFLPRQIKLDHVGILRWYHPKEKDVAAWNKQINLYRKNFKMTRNTKVCSNHFRAGYYHTDNCNAPTQYMKGYDLPTQPKARKQPMDRSNIAPPPKRKRISHDVESDDGISETNTIDRVPHVFDHDYECTVEPCTENDQSQPPL